MPATCAPTVKVVSPNHGRQWTHRSPDEETAELRALTRQVGRNRVDRAHHDLWEQHVLEAVNELTTERLSFENLEITGKTQQAIPTIFTDEHGRNLSRDGKFSIKPIAAWSRHTHRHHDRAIRVSRTHTSAKQPHAF